MALWSPLSSLVLISFYHFSLWFLGEGFCFAPGQLGGGALSLARWDFSTGGFCIYMRHTRPDPITKRISAVPVPPFKWRDVTHIYLPINLLKLTS